MDKEKPLTKRQIKHYADILRDMSLTNTKYEKILMQYASNPLKFEAKYRRMQRAILDKFY